MGSPWSNCHLRRLLQCVVLAESGCPHASQSWEGHERCEETETTAAVETWKSLMEHLSGIGQMGFCAVHCFATVLLEQQPTGCVGIVHGVTFMELHPQVDENSSSKIYRDKSSSKVGAPRETENTNEGTKHDYNTHHQVSGISGRSPGVHGARRTEQRRTTRPEFIDLWRTRAFRV